MKYLIAFLAIIGIWIGSNTFVDLKDYQRSTKTIEVKGEVSEPGVYEVDIHANVQEVLKSAGGVLEGADLSALNLTLDLSNQSVIVVPKTKVACVSITTASLEELTTLNSIGPATASKIIEYRETYGFQTIEDITQVKGIKEKSFDKIKDFICL